MARILLVFLLLWAVPLWAQPAVRLASVGASDTLSSNGDSFTVAVGGMASLRVQSLDSYSGTWEVQCSVDGGTTYDADDEVNLSLEGASVSAVQSVTDTVGVWTASIAGCTHVKIIATAGFAASDTVIAAVAVASGGSAGTATSVPTGTAGVPASETVSVQGVVSGQPVPVSGTVTVDRGTGWSTDPCAGTPSSVVIDTASSGNVELVAISGSTVVYVCGYNFETVGTVNIQFITGTGTACATGETNKTGVYEGVAQWGINTGFAGSTVFKGAAGEAACIELSGAVGVKGLLSYVQQ